MDVFVTGATGWIGSAVVDELLDAGHEVTGLASSGDSAAALERKGARARRGDLDDRARDFLADRLPLPQHPLRPPGHHFLAFLTLAATRTWYKKLAKYAGRGLARKLHDTLLSSRPERRATLLVEPENERAYGAYLRWGWSRVGVTKPSWPDAPTFDVLIRELR